MPAGPTPYPVWFLMIDSKALAPFLHNALTDATIPELPNHYRGKVRHNYDLPDGRRVIIASDRLSAFDIILTNIPFKGQVLTQTARFWFEQTADIIANHVIAYPDPNVVVCKRLKILPVEVVVRDYLTGTTSTSVWSMYKAGNRSLYGITMPDGMHEHQKLPQTIITPTTKADLGSHDEPLSAREIIERGILPKAQWEQVSDIALKLFARGRAIAADHGLILADTKYEFGVDETGAVMLADEIHTPDSSRYWMASSYPERLEAGQRPESFDKDFVRAWVSQRCDPYKDPIPPIPDELVLNTAAVYIDAYERITGQSFPVPASTQPVLERIRANLAAYFPTAA